MKLKEYEGKEIFKKYGIAVPKSFLVKNVIFTPAFKAKEYVVKAQILSGGRGKAGGIKVSDTPNLAKTIQSILGKRFNNLVANEVLVEERLPILEEWYIAIAVDRSMKRLILILSQSGGMDIEEVAKKNPEKIFKIPLEHKAEIERALAKLKITELKELIEKLIKISRDLDCDLVEINPLAKTELGFVAADAKIIIDENALFRHPEIKDGTSTLSRLEKKAYEYDLQYVEMDGNIAMIGNGAGLVMATLDLIQAFGGKPANFLDIGGGADIGKMEKAIEISLEKKPKAILINIMGGITRCDDMANALVNYIKNKSIKIPMAVRMIGTNGAEAQEILKKNRINTSDSLEGVAREVVALV